MIEVTPEIQAKLDGRKAEYQEKRRVDALPTFRCLYRKHKVKSEKVPEKCLECERENLRVVV